MGLNFDFSRPIRLPRGENNRKLTEEQVEIIRKEHAEGVTQTELAKRFGVSQAHIHYIVSMKKRVRRAE